LPRLSRISRPMMSTMAVMAVPREASGCRGTCAHATLAHGFYLLARPAQEPM